MVRLPQDRITVSEETQTTADSDRTAGKITAASEINRIPRDPRITAEVLEITLPTEIPTADSEIILPTAAVRTVAASGTIRLITAARIQTAADLEIPGPAPSRTHLLLSRITTRTEAEADLDNNDYK